MIQFTISTSTLAALNDIDWFDTMCSILEKDKCPTTNQLLKVIGTEDKIFSKENRGSKFLLPFDKRFKTASINPDMPDVERPLPLKYLSFGGINFTLKMSDITKRFPNYKIQRNTYDGGTQLFFYPIDKKFAFSALSFWIEKEPEDIHDINSTLFHAVAFHFGNEVILARDGYNIIS